MFKKILGAVATAAIALGATSAQAVTITNIGTVTGGDQGLDIPNKILPVGSFTDLYKFTVNSPSLLWLDSTVSFSDAAKFSSLNVSLALCTDSTCGTTTTSYSYLSTVSGFRSRVVDPIANGTYKVTVSGNVLTGTSNRYSGQFTFNAVPEPATMGLFGLGLAAVGFVRRRRLAA